MRRTISEHDFIVIRICKTKSDKIVVERLSEYLAESYLYVSDIKTSDLYTNLVKVALNVLNKSDIENILKYELINIKKRDFNLEKELCSILISKLQLLEMRKNGKDVFNIKAWGKEFSYDEYLDYKPKTMIDMDDVIVTDYFLPQLNKYLREHFSLKEDYVEADFRGSENYYMQDKLPNNKRKDFILYYLSEDIYINAKIRDNAERVLNNMNSETNLCIVSSYIYKEWPEKSGIVLLYKHNFLTRNFPFIDQTQYMFGSKKDFIDAETKIDDRIFNLAGANQKVLFSAYHNEHISDNELKKQDIIRANDFNHLEKLLLKKRYIK